MAEHVVIGGGIAGCSLACFLAKKGVRNIVLTGVLHRPLDHAADIAKVLARRELGNDAAPLAMDRHRDAATLERIAHGRPWAPVSATTDAAVSSQEVSMPSMFIASRP